MRYMCYEYNYTNMLFCCDNDEILVEMEGRERGKHYFIDKEHKKLKFITIECEDAIYELCKGFIGLHDDFIEPYRLNYFINHVNIACLYKNVSIQGNILTIDDKCYRFTELSQIRVLMDKMKINKTNL